MPDLEAQKRTLSQFRKLKKDTLCKRWKLKKAPCPAAHPKYGSAPPPPRGSVPSSLPLLKDQYGSRPITQASALITKKKAIWGPRRYLDPRLYYVCRPNWIFIIVNKILLNHVSLTLSCKFCCLVEKKLYILFSMFKQSHGSACAGKSARFDFRYWNVNKKRR